MTRRFLRLFRHFTAVIVVVVVLVAGIAVTRTLPPDVGDARTLARPAAFVRPAPPAATAPRVYIGETGSAPGRAPAPSSQPRIKGSRIQRPTAQAARTAPRIKSAYGLDVSWPQCGGALPSDGYAFAIVGVTHGHAFSANPCLGVEFQWAISNGSLGGLYANINFPPDDQPADPAVWGMAAARDAVATAAASGASTPLWWLDVETGNHWSTDTAANAAVIGGAITALKQLGLHVGIYSTPRQWAIIAGSYAPGLPTWVAGPKSAAGAAPSCLLENSFGGGKPFMVQFPQGTLDGDVLCLIGESGAHEAFHPSVP